MKYVKNSLFVVFKFVKMRHSNVQHTQNFVPSSPCPNQSRSPLLPAAYSGTGNPKNKTTPRESVQWK